LQSVRTQRSHTADRCRASLAQESHDLRALITSLDLVVFFMGATSTYLE